MARLTSKQRQVEAVLEKLSEPERKRSALYFLETLGRGMAMDEILAIDRYAGEMGWSFYRAAQRLADQVKSERDAHARQERLV